MNKTRQIAITSLFAAALATAGVVMGDSTKKSGEPGQQRDARLKKQITVDVDMNYLLYLPEGYGKEENKDKKWPVIMFLHGSGERGSDLGRVKVHGPPKIVEQADRKKDFPFIVVSPQCPEGKWWEPEVLVALLDDVAATYAVDTDRVYLTGLSMGGFGTWETATAYPDRFAAIAPICGGGNKYRVPALKDVPTWVFHGEDDGAVPIAASEEMVNALKTAGGDVQFTRYPGVGHDSWTPTYDNPELYAWFLKHTRGAKAK